jgi:Pvc16 N-terminal domain
MSDYTVLAEAGAALVRVLWEEIQQDPQVNALIDGEDRISLMSPYELRNNNDVRLSLYLYRIVENASMKNQFPESVGGNRLLKPPLTLDLFYLITPLVGPPREQQIILGKVMQVLYDRSTLSGPDVAGSLAVSGDPLRVILNTVALEEAARVWQALEMSYRLSVCYLVRVAMVSSRRERQFQPVIAKQAEYGEMQPAMASKG